MILVSEYMVFENNYRKLVLKLIPIYFSSIIDIKHLNNYNKKYNK